MDSAAAWLLLRLPSGRQVSLPVPRQACLGLARAVTFLVGRLAGPREGAVAESWPEVCWRHAAGSPAVAGWLLLAAGRSDDGAVTGSSRSDIDAGAIGRWLAALHDDLLLPGGRPGRDRAVPAPVPTEIWQELIGDDWPSPETFAGSPPPEAVWAFLHAVDRRAAAWRAAPAAVADPLPPQTPDPAAVLLDEAVAAAVAVAGLAANFSARVTAARLDAIGELAYGAGHEINNPLANIAARAQALLPDESEPERRRRLATIVDQAFRARDMIGGLMIFARPPRPEPTEVSVVAAVAAVVASVGAVAEKRGVRLSSGSLRPLTIWADRSQVEEAVRAVVLNAIEAIAGGGTVGIESQLDRQAEGSRCRLVVSDNGEGMNRETAERIFDPFFSGREAGRGVGLGLSKAMRLIDANGGSIAVASRPRQGTTVSMWLPLSPVGR